MKEKDNKGKKTETESTLLFIAILRASLWFQQCFCVISALCNLRFFFFFFTVEAAAE